MQQVQSKLKCFRRGTNRYKRKIRPSKESILASTLPQSLSPEATPPTDSISAAAQLRLDEESLAMKDLMKSLTDGSHGYVEDKKPSDVIRLYCENVDSLSLYNDSAHSRKTQRIKQINSRFQTDAALLIECGTDFRQVPEELQLLNLLGDNDCRILQANNTTEDSARTQHGGVALLSYQRLSGFHVSSGKDPTGLGRWVWTVVGTGDRKTVIVTAYRPVKPATSARRGGQRGWFTVWSQHSRYFRKLGLSGSPRERFNLDLLHQLRQWKTSGFEIILFSDLNENVYTGSFAESLADTDLLMTECFQSANGREAPASHFRGSTPITGCFCTQGIDVINVMVSPHKSGAGDHRFWIVDLCARSVLGASYPLLVRPKGRRLKCVVDRTAKSYVKTLRRLTDEHNMYSKMDDLLEAADTAPKSELEDAMNRWDRQNVEHKRCAEERCNQFYSGEIDWSPEVGLWITRRDLYQQLKSINSRLRPGNSTSRVHTSHFARACAASNILRPFQMTDAEIDERIEACVKRISDLTPIAPMLRDEHLGRCLSDAIQKGQTKRKKRLIQIIRDERERRKWASVAKATKPRRGGAPTRIKVQDDDGDHVYETRAEVEEHAARKLTSRFKLARHTSIEEGQLFDDFGYLGDTTSTRAILEGTYEFPPDMDPHLRMLLEEAHKVFSNKSTEEISNFISTQDYQHYWSRADEFIQSSYSNIHFGHYKAVARDHYLSALEAAKLSLAAKTGIPLERWGHSLTVLLEKEFGNIYIEKMRAICLMEADFNWLNKLVFAKRMMNQAYDAGLVPDEQFAKASTQASYGVLCKVLFCDMIRALHVTAGIPSVDLGNCYDAVAHPIASIAMQALKVPLLTIVLSLSVLQTMTFYLRTGYGVSETGYGGTKDDPTFGLGQGNGMAPSGFQSVSALMINAYRRLGHASEFTGAWTGFLFALAAVIYVDDTDLFIMASRRDQTLEDFFRQTQGSVTDWGLIVEATGGYIKAAKCFWYMMAWRWDKGVPTLRPLSSLPKFELMIPQKKDPPKPIPMRDVTHCEKTLGVWSCPAGDFGVHIDKVTAKGTLWVERLRRNRCPPGDAWMGFRYALMPQLTYGFAAITPDLEYLEKAFVDLYRNVLSPLKVNMNIKSFYRLAPKRVQGLGMPNPGISMLSHKLQLLRNEWDQATATGRMLRQSYEIFQMEVGLSSNIFTEDFSRLGNLASNGWWKHLWHLCWKYKVGFHMRRKWQIPLLRDNDRSFMDVICQSDIFTKEHKVRINRVRKHKAIHSIADLTLCDGRSVSPSVWTRQVGNSSRVFSKEVPTKEDFKLFHSAVKNLCRGGDTLACPLGHYIGSPHRECTWYTDEAEQSLYHAMDNTSYVVYSLDTTRRPTRHGRRFFRSETVTGLCPRTHHASVYNVAADGTAATLHSSSRAYRPSTARMSFLDRISSQTNASLWKHFRVDGDGSWLYDALLRGSLILVSDGSYNESIARDCCSCSVTVRCRATGNKAKVSWVEQSDTKTADNYRAEILGGIAIQLLLKIIVDGKYIPSGLSVRIGCDNKGVVHHGNKPHRPLETKQAQADVLRYYKSLVCESPIKMKFYHIQGHLDRYLELSDLTEEELANVECDLDADDALHDGVRSGDFIVPFLPDEDLVVTLDGQKVSGPLAPSISRHWGDEQAREHYDSCDIIPRDLFSQVDWENLERAMTQTPEMWSVWVTKHVSGFCGTNHMLNVIHGDVIDKCPSCGHTPEKATHVVLCRHPTRTAAYYESVDRFAEWMQRERTCPELAFLIKRYLLGRGDIPMLSLCRRGSRYTALAAAQDSLGFRNFTEGRIHKLYHILRQEDIDRRGLRKHSGHWCKNLIIQLLQITHRQWIVRNNTKHFVGQDGLTEAQQLAIMRQCEDMMWTDPDSLLPEDVDLLNIDFEQLGDAPAIYRQIWLSEMRSASNAACFANGDLPAFPHALSGPPVDTEGSIRFRRRRRRSLG